MQAFPSRHQYDKTMLTRSMEMQHDDRLLQSLMSNVPHSVHERSATKRKFIIYYADCLCANICFGFMQQLLKV